MGSIVPTRDQFHQFKNHPHQGAIVMINLIKLKANGDALYQEYEDGVGRFIEEVGGRVLFAGKYIMPVIGEGDWDRVIIVEYPSISAFIEMQKNDAYQKILPLRVESLEDACLFMTIP